MRIDMKMEKMSQKALERKSNKPIMEKKRRARINHCLNQLKALILEADNERSRHSKLEKADILEMTVKYLQTFRAYHIHLQQLNQIQQQGQHQIHQQLQQQALGQQRLASGASVSSTPSPPMNLQLSQLALPLQLSLQAAVASVPLQPLSPVSPADSQKSYHHHQHHRQQHPSNHHMSHLSHHLSHLGHLNQQRPVALCTAANQNQEEQMSPTWRPW